MDLNQFTTKKGRFYERHYPGTGDELDPLLNATIEHRQRVKAMRMAALIGILFGTTMVFLIFVLIYSGGQVPPIAPTPPTVNLTSDLVLTDPLVGSRLTGTNES